MFIPPGFSQQSVSTSLGQMVYYTATGTPWLESGHSPPASESLVFLHGFGGGSSAYEWSKVYPAFVNEYRILAPDMIGWGRSSHPARKYYVEDYVQTIIEFMEKMCERPTTVIASALTAAFVVRAAVQRPTLFKSFILTNAAGLNDFGQNYNQNLFAQFIKTPILDRAFYSVGVANPVGIRGFLELRQFVKRDRIYPEIVEAYLQSAQQPNAEYAALSFVRGDLSFDLSQDIAKLTIPTALIWGRGTEYTDPNIGKQFAQLNPQAIRIFQQLDDVGLTPQLELPAVTIGLIRKFLPLLIA